MVFIQNIMERKYHNGSQYQGECLIGNLKANSARMSRTAGFKTITDRKCEMACVPSEGARPNSEALRITTIARLKKDRPSMSVYQPGF